MRSSKGNFIDGAWVQGTGSDIASVNPATSEPLWMGNGAGVAQVDAAFTAARNAFETWSQTDLDDRIAAVLRYKSVIESRKDEISELISRETGKVEWETSGEAGALASKVDISIKAYHDRTGASVQEAAFGHTSIRHRPHGVMAVLGPYNFPAHLPNGHIVPALIAGNTIVFKPSELTPAVGELLIELFADADLPPGVINMVQGGRETGGAILDHKQLDGVLFTGSASTGAFIHEKFGGRPEIILALEMGGNNPMVIWDAKDAEVAASLAAQSAFITTGQRCSCARRLIIPEGRAGNAIVSALEKQAGAIRQGHWNEDPAPFMGPLISDQIGIAVMKRFEELVEAGAKVIKPCEQRGGTSAFVSPGIVDVTGVNVPDEEIFGPVLQIQRVKSFGKAIDAANNTRFGLAAGLVSDNENHWKTFTARIRAGIVNRNRPTTGAASFLPFGGPGLSGNHRPGAYYAADYCAWPMASQEALSVNAVSFPGFSGE